MLRVSGLGIFVVLDPVYIYWLVGGIENSTVLCLNRLRHERANGAGELFLSIDDFVLLLCQFAYERTPISPHRNQPPVVPGCNGYETPSV